MDGKKFIIDNLKYATLTFTGVGMANDLFAGKGFNTLTNAPKQNSFMPSNEQNIVSSTYKLNGKDVKVYAIQTGLISVKTNFMTKKGNALISKLNIFLNYQYTDFLPIWVWVIEHPEGVIVIDTGDIEDADHKSFYKNESIGDKFNLMAMANRRKISKEDELNSQLAKINIKPDQVAKVVLTHLHGDHTDGLKFFPNNEIIVHELEQKHPYGNLPTTYPNWFKPTLINYEKNRVQYFDNAYPITKSEDLLLVPTPGHTHYHSSVLFKTDNEHILISGDASYNQGQLLDNKLAGANVDYKKSQDTYNIIRRYASKFPTIYLPSHDKNSGNRLLKKEIIETL